MKKVKKWFKKILIKIVDILKWWIHKMEMNENAVGKCNTKLSRRIYIHREINILNKEIKEMGRASWDEFE